MATTISKAQKDAIRDALMTDRITFSKDGTFKVKRTFFYSHGRTAESFADALVALLAKAGTKAGVVESVERWNSWPKDSFWLATLRLED
jgi:hypothetical protein